MYYYTRTIFPTRRGFSEDLSEHSQPVSRVCHSPSSRHTACNATSNQFEIQPVSFSHLSPNIDHWLERLTGDLLVVGSIFTWKLRIFLSQKIIRRT